MRDFGKRLGTMRNFHPDGSIEIVVCGFCGEFMSMFIPHNSTRQCSVCNTPYFNYESDEYLFNTIIGKANK
jgi:hypothetical protein